MIDGLARAGSIESLFLSLSVNWFNCGRMRDNKNKEYVRVNALKQCSFGQQIVLSKQTNSNANLT